MPMLHAFPCRLVRAPLAWVGRQGTRALAALVVIGIAFPALGALARPYVTEAIFLLLCISFLRIDTHALRAYLRRPGLVLAATLWTSVCLPLLFGAIALARERDAAAAPVSSTSPQPPRSPR